VGGVCQAADALAAALPDERRACAPKCKQGKERIE
jgi:hypothetical protein